MQSPEITDTLTPELVFAMAAIAAGSPVDAADLAILTAEGLAIATHTDRAVEITALGWDAATAALASLSPLMRGVTLKADMTRQNLPECCDRIAGAA